MRWKFGHLKVSPMAGATAAATGGKMAYPFDLWSSSISQKPLPPVEQIKAICVIDFDNTLYHSPMPSNMWERESQGILQSMDHLLGGGWWQTPSILNATSLPGYVRGKSLATKTENASCFTVNRWNEDIVHVAEMASNRHDTLSVLLTGRNKKLFSRTINELLSQRNVPFDLVVLKQTHPTLGTSFASTMEFKQGFLLELLKRFTMVEKISIYEDRPKHQKRFEDFAKDFNGARNRASGTRKVHFDVIGVPETHINLAPLEEIKHVKYMLRRHNKMMENLNLDNRPPPARLFKRVICTGYMLSSETTERLLDTFGVRTMANSMEWQVLGNILITKMGKCEIATLQELGGIGAEVELETLSFGSLDETIWAVKVRPVNHRTNIVTINSSPTIVLAKKWGISGHEVNKIQNWKDILEGDSQYIRFTATVGEVLSLSISATKAPPYPSSRGTHISSL